MKISLGSDHAGWGLKDELISLVRSLGHAAEDEGTFAPGVSTDYPDWGTKVAKKVASHESDRGILICGTGIGMSIAANKVRGVYAALCSNEYMARMSRMHNDANVLVLGSRVTGLDVAKEIVKVWLEQKAEGGRHLDRRQKVFAIEKESCTQAHDIDRRPGSLIVLDHPLIQHKLTIIRDKDTTVKDFRELVQETAALMVYEVSRDLPLMEVDIETPLCPMRSWSLAGKKLAVVPVLRAGLGMADGILRLIPNAKVGHVGLYRDPESMAPVDYFCKLPNDICDRDIFVVDPMLATGASASRAISLIKQAGGRKITLISLIAAPEGVKKMNDEHPDVVIFTASLDRGLNDHCYIVPGLGDAGDRLFGTK